MRVWCASLVAGLMLIAAKSAFAMCETKTYHTLVRPGPIVVPRDLPVGAVIAEVASDTTTIFNCWHEPWIFSESVGLWALRSNGYVGEFNRVSVFSTNIEGIGVAVGATPRGSNANNRCIDEILWVRYRDDEPVLCERPFSLEGSFLGPIVAKAFVRFYKTAATTGTGTIIERKVGGYTYRGTGPTGFRSDAGITIASVDVSSVSCTLGSAAINVKMGDVSTAAFQGPGTSTASRTQAFKIPLNCAKGTSINVRLDGTAHDANQGMLKLDQGPATAAGVAIQLLYDDKPVKIGERFNGGVADADGEYSIPLKARYVQTAGSVTPGFANGSATFTLTYR